MSTCSSSTSYTCFQVDRSEEMPFRVVDLAVQDGTPLYSVQFGEYPAEVSVLVTSVDTLVRFRDTLSVFIDARGAQAQVEVEA